MLASVPAVAAVATATAEKASVAAFAVGTSAAASSSIPARYTNRSAALTSGGAKTKRGCCSSVVPL